MILATISKQIKYVDIKLKITRLLRKSYKILRVIKQDPNKEYVVCNN